MKIKIKYGYCKRNRILFSKDGKWRDANDELTYLLKKENKEKRKTNDGKIQMVAKYA